MWKLAINRILELPILHKYFPQAVYSYRDGVTTIILEKEEDLNYDLLSPFLRRFLQEEKSATRLCVKFIYDA